VAGPSVVVRILGDLSGLAKSFKDAGDKGNSAARGMREAFGGVLSTLNRTGVLGPFGEALDGVDTALESISKHGKDIGKSLMAAGGVAAAAGVGFSAIGSKDQAAHQQLQTAIEATGKSYEDYAPRIESAIKAQEKFGHTANETQDTLRILTQATGDPIKALDLLGTANDLAAAKHIGLSDAATKLGKVYNGNTKLLKEFGIVTTKTGGAAKNLEKASKDSEKADKALASAKQHLADIEAVDAGKKRLTVGEAIRLRDAQQKVVSATADAADAHAKLAAAQAGAKTAAGQQGTAVDQLSAKLQGQASAAANTFAGHIAAIKARLEDSAASLGQKYGPALTAAGSGMSILGGAVTATKGVIEKFQKPVKAAETAVKDVTVAEEGAQAASGLLAGASGIGLIVIALAALGVAAYAIYKNWDTIWAGMKAAVKVVWDWIKNNWPYLTAILLGPLALVVAWAVKHWSDVTDAFGNIIDWFEHAWQDLTTWITYPFEVAWSAIETAWADVLNWFSGTVGTVSAVFTDIGKAIGVPFEYVFNAIAWAWNHTVGALSFKVPSWVPGLGGKGFAMPQIPTLSFEAGGVVPYTGLIYAHQGETVIPANKRPGPAVVIQNAHFHDSLDVEAFMRKAAWVVQTQGI